MWVGRGRKKIYDLKKKKTLVQTHYLLTDAYFHLLLPVLPVQLRIVRAHSGAGQMKPWLSSQLTVNGPSVKKKKKEKERNVWSKPRSAWFSCGVCRQHPRCFTAAVSPEPGLCELLPTTRHQRRPQGCAALHGHHRSQSIVMYITGASRSSCTSQEPVDRHVHHRSQSIVREAGAAPRWPSFAPAYMSVCISRPSGSLHSHADLGCTLYYVCICISISSWPGSVETKNNPKKLTNLAKSSLPPSLPAMSHIRNY